MSLRWADYRPPAGNRAPSGSTPPGTVVYAIGDIHGRCDLLEAIQRGIAADAKLRPARRRVIVYLGDYISRGVDSRQVVEMVRGRHPDGCEVVTLKGNHEDLLLRYVGGNLGAAIPRLRHRAPKACRRADTPGPPVLPRPQGQPP